MILKFEGYMLPIMKLCLDGKTRKSRDFYSVADLCGITDEEKLEMLASGTQPVYQNRIAWAKSYLLKAGFLERPMKNQYVIRVRNI
ncbi:MAG: winged helix-turn-helix domain-containing protein [Paludibacteraceae bacterium]|nr:winged helix-turn-helix domain-containing protein [Paludibacteraceae bacterium]